MNERTRAAYKRIYTSVESFRNCLRTCVNEWEAENKKIESLLDGVENSFEKAVLLDRLKCNKKKQYEESQKWEKLLTYTDLTVRKMEMNEKARELEACKYESHNKYNPD